MQLWGGGGGGDVGGGVIRTLPLEKSHSIKVNKNMHWTTPDKQNYPSDPAPYVYTWKKKSGPAHSRVAIKENRYDLSYK